MANLLGKRYRCPGCDLEPLVSKAGDGALACCGEPMAAAGAKPLPSSD